MEIFRGMKRPRGGDGSDHGNFHRDMDTHGNDIEGQKTKDPGVSFVWGMGYSVLREKKAKTASDALSLEAKGLFVLEVQGKGPALLVGVAFPLELFGTGLVLAPDCLLLDGQEIAQFAQAPVRGLFLAGWVEFQLQEHPLGACVAHGIGEGVEEGREGDQGQGLRLNRRFERT